MSAPNQSLAGDLAQIPREIQRFLAQIPYKAVFLILFLAWLAFFHFLGNSTLGYTKTTSLFGWMNYVYGISEEDQHGYFIPFVVLALLYWRRDELAALPKQVWWPGFVIVLLGIGIHAIGYLVQQARLSIVGFFVGIYGLTGVIWGWRWLKATFFPFFLFVFCVPLGGSGDFVTLPLRVMATKITVLTSQVIFGINVVQQGTAIYEPSGKFQYEVAAACSGIRSLTAIFALTLIYSFLNFKSWWKRGLLILAAFPLAVISNVIRLMVIILAAETFGQGAGNYVHENAWFSLLPYIPALLGMAALGYFLREERTTPATEVKP